MIQVPGTPSCLWLYICFKNCNFLSVLNYEKNSKYLTIYGMMVLVNANFLLPFKIFLSPVLSGVTSRDDLVQGLPVHLSVYPIVTLCGSNLLVKITLCIDLFVP